MNEIVPVQDRQHLVTVLSAPGLYGFNGEWFVGPAVGLSYKKEKSKIDYVPIENLDSVQSPTKESLGYAVGVGVGNRTDLSLHIRSVAGINFLMF